jgi:hypothetical protein
MISQLEMMGIWIRKPVESANGCYDKVPTDIQSTLKIRTWIVENFAKIFKDYSFIN